MVHVISIFFQASPLYVLLAFLLLLRRRDRARLEAQVARARDAAARRSDLAMVPLNDLARPFFAPDGGERPLLVWKRERWLGVWFGRAFRRKGGLDCQVLDLRLAGWYPPFRLAPPGQAVATLGVWPPVVPDSARALMLNPLCVAALQRLYAVAPTCVDVSGSGALVYVPMETTDLLPIFEAIGMVLESLLRAGPMLPPPGFCRHCGREIAGSDDCRCGQCTGNYHRSCWNTFGGCPSPSCMTVDRIVRGIIRSRCPEQFRGSID
jgi:hypothetical protein